MNTEEINSKIIKYNRKKYINNIEENDNLEESNKMEDSEEPEQEIEEEFTNYQIEESKDNEDINMHVTTRQKLDYYLSNGIFRQILSISSFLFSLTIYIIYVVTTYFPFVNFHWFDILNIIFSSFHILETALYIYLSDHRLIYILSFDMLIKIFTYIYPFFYFINNNISKKIL